MKLIKLVKSDKAVGYDSLTKDAKRNRYAASHLPIIEYRPIEAASAVVFCKVSENPDGMLPPVANNIFHPKRSGVGGANGRRCQRRPGPTTWRDF
ncbi:hypothetical protein EVAR_38708_1 [Eumeta japonica]|uniref:Uncharacterized protein n=1 Tax=Eumeta variegata TaxID=151549 RepID=A0A4C1XKB4_EUMVA|nr:hypothetical protein EVAR_38708_1 [Eumeta japonica]